MKILLQAAVVTAALFSLIGCAGTVPVYRDLGTSADFAQAKIALTSQPQTAIATREYSLNDTASLSPEWDWEVYQAQADSFLTAEFKGLYPEGAPDGDNCLDHSNLQRHFVAEISRRDDTGQKDSLFALLPTVSSDCEAAGTTHLVVIAQPQLYPVLEVNQSTFVDPNPAPNSLLTFNRTRETKDLYPALLVAHGVWNLAEERWDRILAKELPAAVLGKKPKRIAQEYRSGYLNLLPHSEAAAPFLNAYALDAIKGFSLWLDITPGSGTIFGDEIRNEIDAEDAMGLGFHARYLHSRWGGEVGIQRLQANDEEEIFDLSVDRIFFGGVYVPWHRIGASSLGHAFGPAWIVRAGLNLELVDSFQRGATDILEDVTSLFGFYLGTDLELHWNRFLCGVGLTHSRAYSDYNFAATTFDVRFGVQF